MQPSLNSSSPTSRSRVVAIICRLTHIPRLSATASNTGTLRSSIRIVSPHPSRAAAACHTAGTPDDMADTRCCHCCLPACRPAQATTMKMTRKTEEERQRQPRKVLHMPASVNVTARCKKQAQKITDEAFGGGGRPLPPPLGYATVDRRIILHIWWYHKKDNTHNTLCLKNDTDIAHYNLNADQPIYC